MSDNNLRELYVDELKDLYNAENQLLKALPKMAKAASSQDLREGFEEHLQQTHEHVARLEEIFNSLDESPKGKKCLAMEGLVKEGAEVIEGEFEGSVKDAALIGAAQRVEHYEIAAYGTVHEFAKILGETEQAETLAMTLEEEKTTDDKLTDLAKQINRQANEEPHSVQSKSKEAKPSRKKSNQAA